MMPSMRLKQPMTSSRTDAKTISPKPSGWYPPLPLLGVVAADVMVHLRVTVVRRSTPLACLSGSWRFVTLPGVIPGSLPTPSGGHGSADRCARLRHARTAGRSQSRAISEQAQVGCPLDGLRAGRYPELLVDRPEVGLHRVAGNVKSGGGL